MDTAEVSVHVAEMAHIVAASNDGPRGDSELSDAERGAHANLVLLCPYCHTLIDKAPASFPDSMVLEWKRNHRHRIDEAFGAREYDHRAAARNAIEPLLAENRTVFQSWGPHLPYRADPESESADVWKRKVLARILPNNRKILAILDANRKHLSTAERSVLELFRQHVDDLEARHLGDGSSSATGSTFPIAMDAMLEGNAP